MAREARVKNEYGIYYITQTSSSTRSLFLNDLDRDKFLSTLAVSKQAHGFALYAYCIMLSNEYHLIIGSMGNDISKIMKGINISYAMYAAHDEPLFKDRYKSTLIKSKEQLSEILMRIHNRTTNDVNEYNSYCYFANIIPIEGLLDDIDFSSLFEDKDCLKITKEDRQIISTVEQAQNVLNEMAVCKNVALDEIIKDRQMRNLLIRQFRKESTLSLKQLGGLFGNLSESAVSKIIKIENPLGD